MEDLTGPDLYRRNVFRIAGLPSAATPREIRQRRQHLVLAASSGVAVKDAGPVPLPTPPSESQIRAAFDVLADPQQRIVHELFWIWGSASGCGCPSRVHQQHDAAVRAHARALDLEARHPKGHNAERDKSWSAALDSWTSLIKIPGWEKHLRSRIEAIDDPRLTALAAGELKDSLGLTLVTPTALLAIADKVDNKRQLGYLQRWSVAPTAVTGAVHRALEAPLERIDETLREAQRLLTEKNHQAAANLVVRKAKEPLLRVRPVAEAGNHRPAMLVLDRAAILLNNSCMQASAKQAGRWAYDPDKLKEVTGWLDLATKLAIDPESRKNIKQNHDELVAMQDLLDRIDGRPSTTPAPPPPPRAPAQRSTPQPPGSRPPFGAIGDPDQALQRDLMRILGGFDDSQLDDRFRTRLGLPPARQPEEPAATVVHRWMDRIIRAGESDNLFQLIVAWRSRTKDVEIRAELDRQLKLLSPRERERRRRARWRRWALPLLILMATIATYFVAGSDPAISTAVACVALLIIWGIVAFVRLSTKIGRLVISDPDVQRRR